MSTKIGEIVVNQQTAVILTIEGDDKIVSDSKHARDLLSEFSERSAKGGPDGANWRVFALHEMSEKNPAFVPSVDILFGSGDIVLEEDS